MSSECRSRRGTYLLQDSDDIPGVCRVQYCTESSWHLLSFRSNISGRDHR